MESAGGEAAPPGDAGKVGEVALTGDAGQPVDENDGHLGPHGKARPFQQFAARCTVLDRPEQKGNGHQHSPLAGRMEFQADHVWAGIAHKGRND